MPRSLAQIIATADELAARFDTHEPNEFAIRDAHALREVARAAAERMTADSDLATAVAAARADGHSWAAVGAMLGTSGEAARQRYGDITLVARLGERLPVRKTTESTRRRTKSARAVRSKATTSRGGVMPNERTGKRAASNAGKTVGAKRGAKAAKIAAGSALSQRKTNRVTGKKAASNASRTLKSTRSGKAARSAAGSALTQRSSKKGASKRK